MDARRQGRTAIFLSSVVVAAMELAALILLFFGKGALWYRSAGSA